MLKVGPGVDINDPKTMALIALMLGNVHQPLSLRTLASNRVNWTVALLKHPESTFPRIHEYYTEHLNQWKQAHKQHIQKCMQEAFYHDLPVDQLSRDTKLLLLMAHHSEWGCDMRTFKPSRLLRGLSHYWQQRQARRNRVVDRVVSNVSGLQDQDPLPLIAYLVFTGRCNIEDYVKGYAMIPEAFLEENFTWDDDEE